MTNSATIKLHVHLRTDLMRSKVTDIIDTGIPADEWTAMPEAERQHHGDTAYDNWMLSQVEGGWTTAP